jgi:hypothetical protein
MRALHTLIFRVCLVSQLAAFGCGSEDDPQDLPDSGIPPVQVSPGAVGAGEAGATPSTPTDAGSTLTPQQPTGMGGTDAQAAAPRDATVPADTGPVTPVMPLGDAGPMDGDPSKPVVTIPEVPCRAGGGGIPLGRANFKVDDRDVIIDYPCNKHEGAPMTFILNLHGTTPVAQHFYQWGYFSAYKHVASHNLIIATPSSVVQQWGNGDNGADEPYLLHVVDWVYKTFGTKFDIRQMWVGGHSWGSLYTSRFGCHEMLKDKVKGLILMSGATAPACASRVAILNTAAALPSPERLLNQMANATAHGCDASMMRAVDANNDETFWPNCDPGFVHANYLMKTKMHATSMDPSVVKSLVDWIVMARP